MEYSPPPLFKQGASARAKVVFFAVIAIALLLADSRLHALTVIRQVVGTALYPVQAAALVPRDAAYMVGDYFSSLTALEKENRMLKLQQVANAQTLQQAQHLSAENAQLRKLLAANELLTVKSVMSEILYDARDAFTRKIIVDRGTRHGVSAGQPVIDDIGVVGQVTRVFPFTSEVTLLTDKDQAIPVQVVRNGLRSIAYGQGHSGTLDLRFMPVNADIRNGDILVTSGIDGVYPAGLSVAKVVQVESKSTDAFARIICQPLAGIDRNRQLLILLTELKFPPRPAPEDAKDKKAAAKAAAQGAAPKDAAKEGAKPAMAAQAAPAATPGAAAVAGTAVAGAAGAATAAAAQGTPVAQQAPATRVAPAAPASRTPQAMQAPPTAQSRPALPDTPPAPAAQARPTSPGTPAPQVRPAPAAPVAPIAPVARTPQVQTTPAAQAAPAVRTPQAQATPAATAPAQAAPAQGNQAAGTAPAQAPRVTTPAARVAPAAPTAPANQVTQP